MPYTLIPTYFFKKVSGIKHRGAKCSFTLIELIIAVCILSSGIVLILRSLLTAQAAISSGQNRIKAVRFMDEKLAEVRISALKQSIIDYQTQEGTIYLGNYTGKWNLQISPVEEDEKKGYLNEVRITVSWKEANTPKNISLITYLENKE